MKLNQVIFIAFFVFVGGFALDAHGQLVFEETFDTPSDAGLYARLKHHKYLDVVPDLGTDHSPVLKATYKSSKIGSERIVVRYPLNERGMEYTLLFDVKFDKESNSSKVAKCTGWGPTDRSPGAIP